MTEQYSSITYYRKIVIRVLYQTIMAFMNTYHVVLILSSSNRLVFLVLSSAKIKA